MLEGLVIPMHDTHVIVILLMLCIDTLPIILQVSVLISRSGENWKVSQQCVSTIKQDLVLILHVLKSRLSIGQGQFKVIWATIAIINY